LSAGDCLTNKYSEVKQMSKEMGFPEAPVGELVSRLNAHLEQLGYRQSSLDTYGRILKRLQVYCAEKDAVVFTMDLGRDFVQDCYGMVLGDRDKFKNISRAIHMLADFQRFGMIFKQHNCNPRGFSNEYKPLFEGFLESLAKTRLAKGTIKSYRSSLFRLENFLLTRGVSQFSQLGLHQVNIYVESLAGYSKNHISMTLGLMRRLFDYARDNGYHSVSFSSSLPRVKYSQTSRLPVTFTADEANRILENVDTHNPTGIRNYAIMLLVTKLGLRISDAILLRFDSVDWQAKTISIYQQKTEAPLTLPLPDDAGWAIIEYLKHGRPETTCEYVFVRHHAPYDGLASNVQKDMQRLVQKAGIHVSPDKRLGMHSLRHSIASTMLSQGATLSEIAQILGHKSTEVTEDYISLTPSLLRECALEVDF
jgi:site-specific recombinase XerD